ncbi:hypothetical protein QVD17_14528 [Tagetes erecta]|uniref:non-specific serine/threonine protein kinase n=1 Tax=Tagetes erecta TaxID=13708 RepID=A0AAD8L1U5_TARER|nr:hypothetical protein QVD17_14528 [Tagetes erecta]
MTPKSGRIIYSKKLNLYDNKSNELANFSTNFTFVIDSNGSRPYGHGLTFFLAENNSLFNPGGAMGLPTAASSSNSRFRFVAVEFDTFWDSNWDPPYYEMNSSIPIPMGDHVGISTSSLVSVKSRKWSSNVTGGGVCQAWIRYDSGSKRLSVSYTGNQEGFAYTIDLSNELPGQVIFGLSAATGPDVFQRNIVKSWSFESEDLDANQGPGNGKNNNVGLKVGLPVTVSFLVALSIVLWRLKRRKGREDVAEELEFDVEMNKDFEMGSGPKRYSYHELAQSTSEFDLKEKLGEGGFGDVYRAGTLGYLAPECIVTGKASKESDVYSFGVVALEIVCGRKSIDHKAQESQTRLVEWVWELYGAGTLLHAVDPLLGLHFKEEEIKLLMIIGLWCAHPDSSHRPSMRQVIQVLNSEASLPILPSMMPVASYLTPSMSSQFVASPLTQNQSSYVVSNTDISKQMTSSTTSCSSPSLNEVKVSTAGKLLGMMVEGGGGSGADEDWRWWW